MPDNQKSLSQTTVPYADRKFLREFALRYLVIDGVVRLQQRLNDGSDRLAWFDVPTVEENRNEQS